MMIKVTETVGTIEAQGAVVGGPLPQGLTLVQFSVRGATRINLPTGEGYLFPMAMSFMCWDPYRWGDALRISLN
jgi:hypothetical protein